MIFAKACARCHGAGQLERVPCRQCAGQGVQTRTDVVSVAIPAGIADGMRVRVPGEGHAGVRGAASGDLYVEVDVLDDPLFQRRGNDVYAVLPVAVHEAALGARVMVPTPNGPVRVRVLPGTQSGQHLRVRGRGLPLPGSEQRGDLVFEVQVRLPGSLSDRSRALVEEFGRLNPESVRDDRFRVE